MDLRDASLAIGQWLNAWYAKIHLFTLIWLFVVIATEDFICPEVTNFTVMLAVLALI